MATTGVSIAGEQDSRWQTHYGLPHEMRPCEDFTLVDATCAGIAGNEECSLQISLQLSQSPALIVKVPQMKTNANQLGNLELQSSTTSRSCKL